MALTPLPTLWPTENKFWEGNMSFQACQLLFAKSRLKARFPMGPFIYCPCFLILIIL